MSAPIRIANCSGFYGDRMSAAREMVEGGPIDVLTGDWLAELTMLILAKDKLKNPDGGFAKTFLAQLEDVLGTCLDKGIKIVSNAGGLNPAGCATAIEALAARLGLAHPRLRTSTATTCYRASPSCNGPASTSPTRHRREARRARHRADHRQRLPRGMGRRRRAWRAGPTSS